MAFGIHKHLVVWRAAILCALWCHCGCCQHNFMCTSATMCLVPHRCAPHGLFFVMPWALKAVPSTVGMSRPRPNLCLTTVGSPLQSSPWPDGSLHSGRLPAVFLRAGRYGQGGSVLHASPSFQRAHGHGLCSTCATWGCTRAAPGTPTTLFLVWQ